MSTELKLHKFRQRELEQRAREAQLARELRTQTRKNTWRKTTYRLLTRIAAFFA
jgi:hypothetical protein